MGDYGLNNFFMYGYVLIYLDLLFLLLSLGGF